MTASKTSPMPWPPSRPSISPGQSPLPCHPNIAHGTDEDGRFHGLGVGTTRPPAAVFKSDARSTGRPPRRERPPPPPRHPRGRGDGLQHRPAPPPPGTAPPSPRRGHCLKCPGPPPGRTPVDHALAHGHSAGADRSRGAYRTTAPAPASIARSSSIYRHARSKEPGARMPAAPFTGVAAFDRRRLWGRRGG
jgi:hypothetical protein